MLEIINYPEGLPVVAQLSKLYSYPCHNHKDIQILYVLEGELDLKLTYTHYYLAKNSIHIIHSNDVHSIKSITKDNLVIVLNISIAYFTNFFPNLDNIVFTTNVSESTSTYKNQMLLREQIFSIISEQYNKQLGFEARMKEKTISLITTLTNHFRGFVINPNSRVFEHKTAHDLYQIDRISRIVSYVYENYPYKLSLSKLAEKENINLHYLSHLFQKFVGDNFRNFLSLVRVEMSEVELLSTKTSISQIAQNVGFSDAKYYVENFRNWFGMHPKEYRRRYAKEVLGIKSPETEELPLEYLKDTITAYTSLPVFKDIHKKLRLIDINFKEKAKAKLPEINFYGGLLNNIGIASLIYEKSEPNFNHESSLSYNGYYNDFAHSSCIQILKGLIETNRINLNSIEITDSKQSKMALFTENGMKLPLYYLFELLSETGKNMIDFGSDYIVTLQDNVKYIVAFNDSPSDNVTFDFVIDEISSKSKLTEKKLVSSKSCVSYWCQLDYSRNISDKDKAFIERMSMPEISFQIIAKSKNYKHTCILEPKDIALIIIESL